MVGDTVDTESVLEKIPVCLERSPQTQKNPQGCDALLPCLNTLPATWKGQCWEVQLLQQETQWFWSLAAQGRWSLLSTRLSFHGLLTHAYIGDLFRHITCAGDMKLQMWNALLCWCTGSFYLKLSQVLGFGNVRKIYWRLSVIVVPF